MAMPADSRDYAGMAHDNRSRLHWLDVARTAALCGMIAFHFVRDMEMFEFMPPGTTLGGFWAVFARLVAGSFLLLSGVSFVLAHGDGLRLKAWAKRIAVIAGAAVLVSLVTRLVMPHAWIQFGILHAIAAASLLGVILLRAPALVTAAAASAVLGLSFVLGRSLDLPSWMVWTGLGAAVPPSLDYIPLVPWLALFLIGMALAQAVDPARLEPRWKTPPPLALTLPGQHSLLIYLVHQPILIAILAAFSWVLR